MIDSHVFFVEIGQELFEVVLEVRVCALVGDWGVRVQVLVGEVDAISLHFPPEC